MLSAIVLVAAVHTVNGLPSGAPISSCAPLMPQHFGNAPQITPSPHVVDLSNFDSVYNETSNTTTLYYTPDTLYCSM